MDKKQRPSGVLIWHAGHEIVGLLVMFCAVLGVSALQYALFLPQFLD